MSKRQRARPRFAQPRPPRPWGTATATPLADVRAITLICPSEPGPWFIHTNRALLTAGLARWPESAFFRAALTYLDAHPELEGTLMFDRRGQSFPYIHG